MTKHRSEEKHQSARSGKKEKLAKPAFIAQEKALQISSAIRHTEIPHRIKDLVPAVPSIKRQDHEKGRTIFVSGIEESECASIVKMFLKGNRKYLPRVRFVRLPDFSGIPHKDFLSGRQKFMKEFNEFLGHGGNVVIAGSLVAKTSFGYSPVFSQGSMKPADLAVIIEMDVRDAVIEPEYGIIRKKVGMRELSEHQQLNRLQACLLSETVRTVRVEKGNLKKVLKDLREVLIPILGD